MTTLVDARVWGLPLLVVLLAGFVVLTAAQPVAMMTLLGALIRLLASCFRAPAWVLSKVKTASHRTLLETLRWDRQGHTQGEARLTPASASTTTPPAPAVWPGTLVIARLFYLVMGLSILLGTATLEIPRSCVVQFDCTGTPAFL